MDPTVLDQHSTEDIPSLDPTPAAETPSVEALLDSPRWALALRLDERFSATDVEIEDVDRELAERRLARWRAQPPFDDQEAWQRRLGVWGLDEKQLFALLGESTESLFARLGRPAFVDVLAEAYGPDGRFEPFDWPAGAHLDRNRFTALFEPLLWWAFGRLVESARAAVERHAGAPFEPEAAARQLTAHLPGLLAPVLNRTMLVEMHIAKLEERLVGETPEERFTGFVEDLRRPERALEILGNFPVLARLLVERLEQWQGVMAEFLDHLAADHPELEARLHGGRPLGQLAAVGGGVSDSHRGGRGVLLLSFDSGANLVYKPKAMAIEVAFQRLLDWLAQPNEAQPNEGEDSEGRRGLEPRLATLEVIDRGDHGWVEWVEAAACEDEAEMARCYWRLGAYLCLFYVLDGTDFHHENLIASGEHPMPIDLETLFQPWVVSARLTDVEEEPGAPLRASVQRPNLLPERWWSSKSGSVDLSGLGSQEGQVTPEPMLVSTDEGTDTMRMEKRRIEIPVAESRPRLEGRNVTVLDYRDDFDAGFVALYDLLLERRDALLAEGGPLDAFAGSEMRILFRTTAGYGHLLLESFHPHVLGNALERDRLFDRLWNISGHRTWLEELLPTELVELRRCDIPLFLTEPDSLDVCTASVGGDDGADGGARFENFFDQTGLERARQRLRALDARDRRRQLALIQDSLDALRLGLGPADRPSYAFREGTEPASPERLLGGARAVAERLLDRAFVNHREALWMSLDHRDDGWQVTPTVPDVYRGQPGIALFLGYFGALTGHDEATEVARKAIRAMDAQIDVDPNLVVGLGGYNGWGGVLWTLVHLGVLWQDEALLDRAVALTAGLEEAVAEDTVLDFLAGSAGLVCTLLTLHQLRPSAGLLDLARAAGDRLLAAAEPQAEGVGWPMPLAGNRVLAGLSHGAAGFALALLRLHGQTGDERYRETALRALEYERHLYSPERRNWPDLRAGSAELSGLDPTQDHYFMLGWCHGAPGIGQARVAGLPLLDDETVRGEIRVAIESTIASGFGTNHSLCHGDLGHLDFLLDAAQALGDDALRERVYHLATGVLDGMDEHGWLFGLPGNIETPGLMVGLAGIGQGLLRLAAPDRVPSVLTLGPPPISRP